MNQKLPYIMCFTEKLEEKRQSAKNKYSFHNSKGISYGIHWHSLLPLLPLSLSLCLPLSPAASLYLSLSFVLYPVNFMV